MVKMVNFMWILSFKMFSNKQITYYILMETTIFHDKKIEEWYCFTFWQVSLMSGLISAFPFSLLQYVVLVEDYSSLNQKCSWKRGTSPMKMFKSWIFKCKRLTVPNVGENVELHSTHTLTGDTQVVQGLWKTICWFLKVKHTPTVWASDPIPIYLPERTESTVHTKSSTWMLTAALCVVPQTRNNPGIHLQGECTYKLWYIHTTQFASGMNYWFMQQCCESQNNYAEGRKPDPPPQNTVWHHL